MHKLSVALIVVALSCVNAYSYIFLDSAAGGSISPIVKLDYASFPFFTVYDSGLSGVECFSPCYKPGSNDGTLAYRTTGIDCSGSRNGSSTTCFSFNTAISSSYNAISRVGYISGLINTPTKRITSDSATWYMDNIFFVSAWIKPSSSMGSGCGAFLDMAKATLNAVTQSYESNIPNYFSLYFPTCSSINITSGASASWKSYSLSTSIAQDAWNHVLLNYNGVTGSFTFYVNGVQAAQGVTSTNTFPFFTTTGQFYAYVYSIGAIMANLTITTTPSTVNSATFVGAMDRIMLQPGLASTALISSIYSGEYICDGVAASNPSVCGGIGTCIGNNQCTCNGPAGKWSGSSCSTACSKIALPASMYAAQSLNYYRWINITFSINTMVVTLPAFDTSALTGSRMIQQDCSDVRIYFHPTANTFTNADQVTKGRQIDGCGTNNTVITFGLETSTTFINLQVSPNQYSLQYGGKYYSFSKSLTLR
jgi:hypothetical protein